MRPFTLSPVILLAAILAGPAHLTAQEFSPRFDHLTPASGLSQDIVTCIAQDREGFLWFGTEDGLNRYDGTSFRVFKTIDGDSTSLPSRSVKDILVAPDGALWVAALGLNRYDPMTESFVRYPLEWLDPESAGPGNETLALCCDSAGSLWASTGSSIVRISPGFRSLDRFRHIPGDRRSLAANLVQALLCDRKGRLWVGTSSGVDRYEPSIGGFVRALPDEGGDSRPLHVTALQEDHAGRIWIGLKEGGALRFDPSSGARLWFRGWSGGPQGLSDGRVFDIAEDPRGRVWIGHFSGVDVCDPDRGVISRLRNDPQIPSSISGSRVYAVLADRRGTVWMGTYHGGVSSYTPARNRFGTIRQIAPGDERSPDVQVLAVAESRRGGIWCGTGRGLAWISPEGGSRAASLPRGIRLPPLPQASVLALLEDRQGRLWVAYDGGAGLRRIDLRTGIMTSIDVPLVRTLYEDREGEVWIGLWFDGVIRSAPAHGRLRHYRSDDGSSHGLIGGGVWAIHQDRSGAIWMGTWGVRGLLNRFDRSTETFTQFLPGVRGTARIGGNAVRGIAEEPDGTLWFGTWGMGLHRYDPGTGKFSQYFETDGLPNSFIKGLLLDDRRNLWISTERGLCCRESATGRFLHFTTADGLPGDRFLSGSCLRGKNGLLYFGGEQGLTYFHPDSIRPNPLPPPVVISAFRIFDRIQPRSTWASGTVRLEHEQDFISFDFVGLDYTDPARNRYAYRMEGFDRDWIESGTRRYAAYTHLDGGEYTFRVRAANSDGTWNLEGTSLRILIKPPYWKTWWFLAGVLLAGAGVLYGGFRLRLRQQLEIERLRQRIAGDLHDDVGTELSSIVVGSQILARTLPLSDGERERVRDLGRLGRRAHEMLRDIVWVLSPENGTIDEFVLKMREVAGRLLEGKEVVLDLSPPSGRRPIALEVKRNLFLFYKECLSNVVRHSEATSVLIRFQRVGDEIELVIADNGRGFDPRGERPGLGLGNLRRRAGEMKARLQIDSNPGGGTTVSLRIRPT